MFTTNTSAFLSCSTCGFKSTSETAARLHVKFVHKGKMDLTEECFKCNKKFTNTREMDLHLKSHDKRVRQNHD